jgi:predicted outer membrane repeat protein
MNTTIQIRRTIVFAAIFALVIVSSFSVLALRRVRAATLTVINTNDSGFGSLRAAVAAAQNGDTVNFNLPANSTITLNSQISILQSISIQGTGKNTLTISGNGTTRLFLMNSGAISVEISGLTLRSGYVSSDHGGTISNTGGSLTIRNTMVANSSAISGGQGGAIFHNGGSLTIIGSEFISNASVTYGGAIYINSSSTYSIRDSIFLSNSVQNSANSEYYGGAIFTNSSGSIENSEFKGNFIRVQGSSPYARGGAIGIFGLGVATIKDSLFASNAVYSGYANQADGGAIYNAGVLAVTNTSFFANIATRFGGAIASPDKALTVTLSTFFLNAASAGGGIYSGNNLTLSSSIVAGSAGVTEDVTIGGGTLDSRGYNLVQRRGTLGDYVASDLPNGTDPLLNLPANNGGFTKTMSLQAGSPAIDAIPGTGGCNGANITTDQRGASRPQGAGCEIGAYEIGNLPTPTPTNTPIVTPSATFTPSATPQPRVDTIGLYRVDNNSFTFYLRTQNNSGPATYAIQYGFAGTRPVVGDWNGDGVDTIGIYNQSNGVFLLRNSNTAGNPELSAVFGNPNDTPLGGKWDNTMSADSIGVFRPSNGILYLSRTIASPVATYSMVLGSPGDVGIAGDWDGNGYDSVGVYRASVPRFYLSNNNGNGITFSDLDFAFSVAGGYPFAGDWTGNGVSKTGFYANGIVYHRNTLTTGNADYSFGFGDASWTVYPIAGKWAAGSMPPPANILSVPLQVNPAIEPGAGD